MTQYAQPQYVPSRSTTPRAQGQQQFVRMSMPAPDQARVMQMQMPHWQMAAPDPARVMQMQMPMPPLDRPLPPAACRVQAPVANNAAPVANNADDSIRVVSLGSYCGVRQSIKRSGYDAETLPFDWMRTRATGILHFLQNDFAGFMDFDTQQEVPTTGNTPGVPAMVMYRDYWHSFWHDDPTDPKDQEKYSRRIERFQNLGSRRDRTLLFVRSMATVDELHNAAELLQVLTEQFGDNVKLMIIVDFQRQYHGPAFVQGLENLLVYYCGIEAHQESAATGAPYVEPIRLAAEWAKGHRQFPEARRLPSIEALVQVSDITGGWNVQGLEPFEDKPANGKAPSSVGTTRATPRSSRSTTPSVPSNFYATPAMGGLMNHSHPTQQLRPPTAPPPRVQGAQPVQWMPPPMPSGAQPVQWMPVSRAPSPMPAQMRSHRLPFTDVAGGSFLAPPGKSQPHNLSLPFTDVAGGSFLAPPGNLASQPHNLSYLPPAVARPTSTVQQRSAHQPATVIAVSPTRQRGETAGCAFGMPLAPAVSYQPPLYGHDMAPAVSYQPPVLLGCSPGMAPAAPVGYVTWDGASRQQLPCKPISSFQPPVVQPKSKQPSLI